MKGLGYKTVFWYGGFSTWQNIKDFVLAQGFDEFHDASEMKSSDEENAWGVPDQVLFDAVEHYMKAHQGEKIVNVILTTSNHPPYSIPVDDLGYDREKVIPLLPDSIKGSDKNLTELGHIWYADQTMGHFVEHMETADPSALFVITGDHSERFTFARDVSLREKSAIPLIIYGSHIDSTWFTSTKPVLSIQLIPTLAELVGRQGDQYTSIIPSIFSNYQYAFNHNLWSDQNGIYSHTTPMPQDLQQLVDYSRELAVWRVKHGNSK
nr:sulfatase-like hydrolase/transferase [Veillonella agrestimuris]